jgi:Ferritin-like domain
MNDTQLIHPELAEIEIEPINRSDLVMKGVLAAGAVYGLGMVGPFLRQAFAKSSDVDILNYALTLEYLESAFYDEAKTRVMGSGDLMSLINLLADDESQHVAALTASIKQAGGTPVPAPKVAFPYNNTAGFLKLAQTFEDTGVSAYNGAAPMISSKAVLGSAGSIVQVEARHAAAIRLQNQTEPAPDAFDPSLSMEQVTKAVQPFIKS